MPSCPGDHKGWVKTKLDQLKTFYTQGGFGYVQEQRQEMMVMCEPTFMVVTMNGFLLFRIYVFNNLHFFDTFCILVIYYFKRHFLKRKVCNMPVCYFSGRFFS